MLRKNGHPTWWQTWATVVLFGLGCLWIVKSPLSAMGHEEADLAAIALVYGLLFLWLRANQGAWLSETYDQRSQQVAARTDDAGPGCQDLRVTD